jgi:hypothetical protein
MSASTSHGKDEVSKSDLSLKSPSSSQTASKNSEENTKSEDSKMPIRVKPDPKLEALFEACDECVGEIVPSFGGDRDMDHIDVSVSSRERGLLCSHAAD